MVVGSVEQLPCLLGVAAVERNDAVRTEQPGDQRVVTGLGREGFQNSVTAVDLRFQAARSYS